MTNISTVNNITNTKPNKILDSNICLPGDVSCIPDPIKNTIPSMPIQSVTTINTECLPGQMC